MRDVFPDAFDQVDYENLEDAVKTIENRLRYSEERIDFAIRNVSRNVDEAGSSPEEIIERMHDAELEIGSLKTQVGNLSTILTQLVNSSRNMVIKTGRVPPTGSTPGALGQLYIDTYTDDLYYCKSVDGTYYIWQRL